MGAGIGGVSPPFARSRFAFRMVRRNSVVSHAGIQEPKEGERDPLAPGPPARGGTERERGGGGGWGARWWCGGGGGRGEGREGRAGKGGAGNGGNGLPASHLFVLGQYWVALRQFFKNYERGEPVTNLKQLMYRHPTVNNRDSSSARRRYKVPSWWFFDWLFRTSRGDGPEDGRMGCRCGWVVGSPRASRPPYPPRNTFKSPQASSPPPGIVRKPPFEEPPFGRCLLVKKVL